MARIKKLSKSTINKIAAGEVIERPAYAVKELIENSIDAGADSIRIDIEKSGLEKIVITDNGEGMNKEDIQLAFLPHTTSKISHEDDLHHIQSLGFRGEALSSIAAVSNLTIRSKRAEDVAGTKVELQSSTVQNISPIGMPAGTSVTVNNLFSSVPARKKFLHNLPAEYRHIIQIITRIALAHPQIRFFVTHNKKNVLDLPRQTVSERVVTVVGKDTFTQFIPIQNEHLYFQVAGYIAKPQFSQSHQTKSFIFVNNRPINSTHISRAVREAYGTLLPPSRYPIFLLFLTLPAEMVDVNIHPQKEEIDFLNQDVVIGAVQNAIQKSLSSHHLTFQDKRWRKNINDTFLENFTIRDGSTQTYAAGVLKDTISNSTIIRPKIHTTTLTQLNNLYIVSQTDEGLILIDQHAAHERILYEELIRSFRKARSAILQRGLHNPILLNLSIMEREILETNTELFAHLGFEIVHFSGATYKINAVPQLFIDRNIGELLREMLEDIAEYNRPKEIDIRSQRMLTYIACRSAIKAGDTLTKQQMKDLLQKLEKAEHNTTCPHGRPTQIEIALSDLHRLFRRA